MPAAHAPIRDFIKMARQAHHLTSLEFPTKPVPAGRPRVSKWGVYYGKTYKAWREVAAGLIDRGYLDLDKSVPLLVLIESVGPRPKTTKRGWPVGDVDNFAKAPMDIITDAGGYWHDDDQVTWLVSGKRYATPAEEPHTSVHIYECREDDR